MRSLICLTLYLTMLLVGLGLIVWFLLHGGKYMIVFGGGFTAFLGAYLLWTDFLSPNRKPL